MHTEHLQRVRLTIVAAAWLVAAAVTSLIIVALVGLNLLDPDSTASLRVSIAAVAFGFFAGGLFAGFRAGEAPILHGVAIGLLSLVIWFTLNVLAATVFNDLGWQALAPGVTVTLILVQMAAAVVGARLGYRVLRRDDR